MASGGKCSWLHSQLESSAPLVKFPFNVKSLPSNGIYFFYEEGEIIDHGDGPKPRIVRIGTHKENNFQSRISEHFLLNESKLNFTIANPKPSDRSIFRKNIGRALLNKNMTITWKIGTLIIHPKKIFLKWILCKISKRKNKLNHK